MATTRRSSSEVPNKWRDDEDSSSCPDPTKIWKEPASPHRRVPVVYYLSRNGNLEHPHFMEITLSSSHGLFLRDFINRLNQLRGKGIASIYSWSSKRSYKNGYVWHDLAENDFIYPSHGTEYVLKGSELLDVSPDETPPFQSPTSAESQKLPTSSFHANPRAVSCRRRNQSMSAIDLDRDNYKVYRTESMTRSRAAADASTQTYDQRRDADEEEEIQEEVQSSSTETSPPPVDSSPETLQTMLKTHGRLRLTGGGATEDGATTQLPLPGGRLRASSILMQMISCGAVSFKDCGVSLNKGQALSMVANSKVRVRRGAGNHLPLGTRAELLSGHGRLEDKEYFSGSLVETKKEVVPVLKRSSSYNMDRSFDSKIDRPTWNEVHAKARPISTKKKPA